ncbi:hypothetical protein G7046_g4355 [Stylonectria norvegica]|nr:hypothetical protein G7046_g4355 [Stylonectria norvegica]
MASSVAIKTLQMPQQSCHNDQSCIGPQNAHGLRSPTYQKRSLLKLHLRARGSEQFTEQRFSRDGQIHSFDDEPAANLASNGSRTPHPREAKDVGKDSWDPAFSNEHAQAKSNKGNGRSV